MTKNDLKNDIAWWHIYFHSFPAKERDKKNQIIWALEMNLAKIGCYYSKQHLTQGIVVLYHMQQYPFVFLNYFALEPALRGKGIGSAWMKHIIKKAEEKYPKDYLGLVLEVEDPAFSKNSTEYELKYKRLQFYERLGGNYFNAHYIQPPIDGKNSLPMHLMYFSNKHHSDMHLYEKKIIETIYFEKYHVVNQIDRTLLETLLVDIYSKID